MATDEQLLSADEQRLWTGAVACALHLADLLAVHGLPPKRTQPESFGRTAPSPPGAKFPQRETLATIS